MRPISQSALDLLTHLSLASQVPPVSWEAASYPVTGQSLLVRGSFCRLVYVRTERVYLDRQALQELYATGLVEQLAVSRTKDGVERIYGRGGRDILVYTDCDAPGYGEDEATELLSRKRRGPEFVFARGLRLTEAGRAFMSSQVPS